MKGPKGEDGGPSRVRLLSKYRCCGKKCGKSVWFPRHKGEIAAHLSIAFVSSLLFLRISPLNFLSCEGFQLLRTSYGNTLIVTLLFIKTSLDTKKKTNLNLNLTVE